jgi:hypothetical protein
MKKPIVQPARFPRVEECAPFLVPFVEKREKELNYSKRKLGEDFHNLINQSFEEVINKAVDLFVLASQSPRGFKLIRERRESNPERFREEMTERYESLDDLQKAYVDLDKMMLSEFWKEKYGTAITAIPMIAAGAMLFIDQQIDKQLKPQKHVTWAEDIKNIQPENQENKEVSYWVSRTQDKQNLNKNEITDEEKSDKTNSSQGGNGLSQSK